MLAQRMENDVIRRNHARGHGLHDHLVRTAEMRRLQADAIAKGVHWVWTNARRIAERLMRRTSRGHEARGEWVPKSFGRATVADAIRRDFLRLARLVHRYILEPHARRRRRRIAIAQMGMLDDHLLADIGLTRGQIELAVDGMLARRGDSFVRPVGRSLPTEEPRHELPLAA
jgi:uncharacterized protein YjiS (DUF1127 family)